MEKHFPHSLGLGVYAMYTILLAVFLNVLCVIIHWIRANAQILWGFEWTAFHWWFYTGLFTTYFALTARLLLVNYISVWQITLLSTIITLSVEMILNTIYFGFNPRMCLAMSLVGAAAMVAKS